MIKSRQPNPPKTPSTGARIVPITPMMNRAVIEQWCTHLLLRNFAHSTITRRRWSLHTLSTATGRRLDHTTAADIEQWLAQYPDPQTRYSILCDARSFYRWATKRAHYPHDPTLDIDLPKLPRRLPTPLSVDHVRRLIDNSTGEDQLIALLGCHAGLRVSEIGALRHHDVADQRIHIRDGKGGKDRSIPISPELATALAQSPTIGHYLPTLRTGSGVSTRLRRRMRTLDIPGRPHDTRHSFGTELARRGTPVHVIAQLMGHTSLQTTLGYILLAAPTAATVDGLYGTAVA